MHTILQPQFGAVIEITTRSYFTQAELNINTSAVYNDICSQAKTLGITAPKSVDEVKLYGTTNVTGEGRSVCYAVTTKEEHGKYDLLINGSRTKALEQDAIENTINYDI